MAFSGAAIGCWDETGEILRLNDAAIVSPTKHIIAANASNTSTAWHHGSHYSNILTCEQKEAFDSGRISGAAIRPAADSDLTAVLPRE